MSKIVFNIQSLEHDERLVYTIHLFIKLIARLCYAGTKHQAYITGFFLSVKINNKINFVLETSILIVEGRVINFSTFFSKQQKAVWEVH